MAWYAPLICSLDFMSFGVMETILNGGFQCYQFWKRLFHMFCDCKGVCLKILAVSKEGIQEA
jgi:hypothetical protein